MNMPDTGLFICKGDEFFQLTLLSLCRLNFFSPKDPFKPWMISSPFDMESESADLNGKSFLDPVHLRKRNIQNMLVPGMSCGKGVYVDSSETWCGENNDDLYFTTDRGGEMK